MRITLARTLELGYSTKQAAWSIGVASNPTLRQRVIRTATSMVRQLAFPDIQVLWLPGVAGVAPPATFGSGTGMIVIPAARPSHRSCWRALPAAGVR